MNKEDLNKSGIYQIVNSINKKRYIGSAINFRKRWKSHRSALRKKKHVNNHLQSTFNKFGFKNFSFEILEFVDDVNNLIVREQYWIDFHKSFDNKFGYNISPKAGSRLGSKFSSESLKRLSDSHKGNKHTKETKRKISQSQYKPVYQIDSYGNIINEFSSCIDAEKNTNTYRQSISMCCRKIMNYANGYQWCYKSDIKSFVSKLPKGCKKIGKFDKDKLISQWNSISDAVNDTGLPRISICRKLKIGIEYKYV